MVRIIRSTVERFYLSGIPINQDPDAELRVAAGTAINLAGSNATVPMSANLVSIQLNSNELADDPSQRTGPLKGQTVILDVRNGKPAIVSDSLSALDLALAGVGLAYIFEPLVRADIEAGRLTEVLPQASIEEAGLLLYFPRRASMAPKLRAFIDTARAVALRT